MFQQIYLFNTLSCTTSSPVFKVRDFGLYPAIIRLIHYLEPFTSSNLCIGLMMACMEVKTSNFENVWVLHDSVLNKYIY